MSCVYCRRASNTHRQHSCVRPPLARKNLSVDPTAIRAGKERHHARDVVRRYESFQRRKFRKPVDFCSLRLSFKEQFSSGRSGRHCVDGDCLPRSSFRTRACQHLSSRFPTRRRAVIGGNHGNAITLVEKVIITRAAWKRVSRGWLEYVEGTANVRCRRSRRSLRRRRVAIGSIFMIPALCTTTLIGPNAFSLCSEKRRSTSAASATSPCTATARPPPERISETTSSAFAVLPAKFTTTAEPSRASRSAMARPIPARSPGYDCGFIGGTHLKFLRNELPVHSRA